jgi:flagellar basal-body rod protein FlgF
MGSPFETTSSSLEALNERYQLITHNMANVNTVGFKRVKTKFEQALASKGGGGKVSASPSVDFTQGPIMHTGRSLDLAIDGHGFFSLETPKGTFYTRNGTFTVNAQGQLVDTSGRLVVSENGPISVPKSVSPMDLHVTADGSVQAAGRSIGKLKIVDFENRAALVASGSSAFHAGMSAKMIPASKFSIQQGQLESSNVNIIEELTGLIMVTRLYEANTRTINTHDDRGKELMQVAMA